MPCPKDSPKFAGARRIQPIPDLLRKEWAGAQDIDQAKSRDKATWFCSVCGHRWVTRLSQRLYGCGCPRCARAALRLDIPAEIIPRWREPMPLTKFLPFHRPYRWRCEKGHLRRASIAGVIRNPTGCPFCGLRRASHARSPRTLAPHMVVEWAEPRLKLEDVPTKIKYRWRHVSSDPRYPGQIPCGKKWKTSLDKRLHGFGCPHCKHRNVQAARNGSAMEKQ